MFVRFVKDYKKFKKDTIIKCNSLHGNALIKNGYAVKQGRCYKIKDLYIAELATVNRVPLGFQSITLKPEGYSIFCIIVTQVFWVILKKEECLLIY